MGIFERIGRVVRANVNDLIDKAEDPEKVLDQALLEMNDELIKLRQAVAKSIATQKRTAQQVARNQQDIALWQERAQLALSKGDEKLARESLVRKQSIAEPNAILEQQLATQNQQVETLKGNLRKLEDQISEAKNRQNLLKARAQAAKVQKKLSDTTGEVNLGGSLAAFDRLEEQVLALETENQVIGELADGGLEKQFQALEAGETVDDELAAMKRQLQGDAPDQSILPPGPASEP